VKLRVGMARDHVKLRAEALDVATSRSATPSQVPH
jgi:hypothetical protein